METEIITKVNEYLQDKKLSKKAIYENLLSDGIVRPNSERLVYETLSYGIGQGFIKASKIIKWKKRKGRLPETFTNEQLIKIFDEVDRPKLAVCMWLGFFCGMRIREICQLQIEDIDLDKKKIFIRDSKNPNRLRDGYGKDRVVTIPTIAISPIQKWLSILQGGKWAIPSMQDENKPIRTKTIHEQYRQLLNKCGLSSEEHHTNFKAKNHGVKKDLRKTTYKLRFHTLRHTYASYLLDKNVPLENISRTLGHNQLDTTLIYARVRDTKTEQLINQAFDMPMRLVDKTNRYVQNSDDKKITENQNISATEILRRRLASGEIDLISYRRLLTELNSEDIIKEKC